VLANGLLNQTISYTEKASTGISSAPMSRQKIIKSALNEIFDICSKWAGTL
jgi:hypothetical protein